MKTNNISPEVKTGIYNIVSAVKKHAEAAEQLKNTAASKALPHLKNVHTDIPKIRMRFHGPKILHFIFPGMNVLLNI